MSTDLPGLSVKNLKMDMIQFQDETLKNIRLMQSKLDNKYAKSDEFLNENITKFDLKIKALEKKITELSNLILIDNTMKEKLESLFKFKEETQDILIKRSSNFNDLERKLNVNMDEVNKILTNSVIYPAVIGKTAKFQTFHEFIDYVIQEISQLNIFKKKSQIDSMTSFKKKIDGILNAFKIQMNNLMSKEKAKQLINDLEERMNSTFKLYDERLQDARVENANYSIDIQKKAEEMNKQINNLFKAQNYMDKKFEKLQKFELINILSNEIIETNDKINKAFIILNDLASFHPEVKRNYRQEFEKKPSKKIISRVKEYIKGFISADEISPKKFSYEKSKTKIIDTSSLNQKIIQNVSPENSFNNKNIFRKKSVNISLQDNLMPNKFAEFAKFQRNIQNRKNTISFRNNNNFESSKINNFVTKLSHNNDFFNKQTCEPINNKITNFIIEEENEVNNNSDNENKNIPSKKNKTKNSQLINNIETKSQINNNISNNSRNLDTNEDEEKNDINLNMFNNYMKEQKEKKMEIRSHLLTETDHFNNNIKNSRISPVNQDSLKKEIINEQKPFKLNLKNNINSQESLDSEIEIKNNSNQKTTPNQITNLDRNISPIKTKLYKTYSNFPKINHDKNNRSIPDKRDNYKKSINTDDFYKTKILMLKPDDSPLNNFYKTFNDMFRVNIKINANKSVRVTKSKKNDINNLKYFVKKDKSNDNKL